MDYLIPLMKLEPSDSHLQHAFNACALASLSSRASATDSCFRERAYDAYTQALSATNIALKDPDGSRSDATLATVLLLGMFEVSCPSRFSGRPASLRPVVNANVANRT